MVSTREQVKGGDVGLAAIHSPEEHAVRSPFAEGLARWINWEKDTFRDRSRLIRECDSSQRK